MEITAILIMSVVIEAIITYIKTWAVDKEIKWQMIVSVLLSIGICLAYGLDIPAAVGIESNVKFVGNIVTGILVSRGSNYIFDLLKLITSKKTASATEVFGADASDGVEI